MADKPKIRSDQVENLAKILKNKRIAVFIDAANLYYAGVKAGIRPSFETLAQWFKQQSVLTHLNFYTAYDPEGSEQMEFLSNLEKIGYTVIKKPIKIFETLTKGNMDIELAVDAMTLANSYDVCILMSGDGDFSYLMNHLKVQKKETIVLSVGGYTSYELHKSTDHYFFLDRLGKIWQNKLRFNLQNYKIFLDTLQENDYLPTTNKTSSTTVATSKPLEKLKLRLKKSPSSSKHTKQ